MRWGLSMISSRSTLAQQTGGGYSPNYVVLRHLATATVLAVALCGTPIASSDNISEKRFPVISSQGIDFFEKTPSGSVNISIIAASGACNTAKSVHTPVSSARMSDGGVMSRALSKLEGLKQLENGWAGYESKKPDLRSLSEAAAFASRIFSAGHIIEPIISPATDGEISFYWENSYVTLDLGFYGDGSYSFYAKTEDGEEFFGDHYSLDEALPQKIFERLQKV